jgi:iron complex outermembrane receptor protein
MKFSRLSSCLTLAAVTAGDAGAQPVSRLDPVVVSGTRASLESALQRKRDAPGIVDSIVAEDVHRLPDLNVADALQRVTGVQVGRDRGEGSAVSVRGLLQVETTFNGREVFTAGTGRTLDFADIAAETLAGIDVHKTSAADRIEGGLGGTIDLRLYRPFDFRADAQMLTVRAVNGDLSGRTAGQVSGLVVRRWRVGDGELGVLVNAALQERRWREDQKGSGTPLVCSDRTTKPNGCPFDLVPGQDVVVPSATSETTSAGKRRRTGGSAIVEWRPTPSWDVYAEAHLAELRTVQESNQINVGVGSGFVPGSVALFPGTNDLQRITWTNAPVSILNFARDTIDRTQQLALGTRWRGEGVEIEADASRTRSRNHLYFAGPFFAATAAQFTHDLSGDVPATSVSGTNLADPSQIRYAGYAYRTRPFEGELDALRLDARWSLDGGVLEQVAVGWRHAERSAHNQPGLVFGDSAITRSATSSTARRAACRATWSAASPTRAMRPRRAPHWASRRRCRGRPRRPRNGASANAPTRSTRRRRRAGRPCSSTARPGCASCTPAASPTAHRPSPAAARSCRSRCATPTPTCCRARACAGVRRPTCNGAPPHRAP